MKKPELIEEIIENAFGIMFEKYTKQAEKPQEERREQNNDNRLCKSFDKRPKFTNAN